MGFPLETVLSGIFMVELESTLVETLPNHLCLGNDMLTTPTVLKKKIQLNM